MKHLLNGNFEVKRPPAAPKIEQDLTDRFEREALKRLGGSIAFVSTRKFLYGATPVTTQGAQADVERPTAVQSSRPADVTPAVLGYK